MPSSSTRISGAMLCQFVVLFVSYVAAFHSSRGEYKESWYNASQFTSGGSSGKCTVTASYGSDGRNALSSQWRGCDWEKITYESQQEFDLQLFELFKVCPYLERLPESYYADSWHADDTKHNLPTSLIWTTSCSMNTANCPRFHCSNDSKPDEHDWYTAKEITTLEFSDTPLKKACYECSCEAFTRSGSYVDSARRFAWDCTGSSWDWQVNPIDDGADVFDNMQCYAQSRNPTTSPTPAPSVTASLSPTDSPSSLPTLSPSANTASPSWLPTVSPIPYCEDAFNRPHAIGEYYWDTSSTTSCTGIDFCYCDEGASPYCFTGYDNIMSDDVLYYGFLSECGQYLTECWRPEDEGRLFQYYSSAQICSVLEFSPDSTIMLYTCPRCGCDENPFVTVQGDRTNTSFNTTTYYAVQNASKPLAQYVYEFACEECSCVLEQTQNPGSGTVNQWVSYVDPNSCNAYDVQNNNELDDCIYAPRRCYSNYGEYDPFAGSTTCNNQRGADNEFESACSYERLRLDGSIQEEVCVEDEITVWGQWGCGDSYECEVFASYAADAEFEDVDGCWTASLEFDVVEYDCLNGKWIGDTYKGDVRKACCSDGWNCNNRTIEEYASESCSNSEVLKNLRTFEAQCARSQRNLLSLTGRDDLIRAAYCGDPLEYANFEGDEQSMCELLQVYWQYSTFCDCNSAKWRIKTVSEARDGNGIRDYQLLVNMFKNDFWTSSRRSMAQRLYNMSGYWDCSSYDSDADSFFTCDFDADPASIDNQYDAANRRLPFSWSLFAIVAVSLLYNKHERSLLLLCVLVAASFLSVSHAQGISDWGRTGGDYDNCVYRRRKINDADDICEEVETYEYVHQNEDLTWDILVEACPNLEREGCYTPDQQLAMEDLVWPNYEYACTRCPKCPCSNETDTVRYNVWESYSLGSLNNLINRYCSQCTCTWYSDDFRYGAWVWDCFDTAVQSAPYSVNDTYFCVPTPEPTMAPTVGQLINCMDGDDFDNLGMDSNSKYGQFGGSHCGWANTTMQRYDDGEPTVCVNDEVENNLGSSWFTSPNAGSPYCLAIAGDDTGCYYADFDLDVEAYDCVLEDWVSDRYRVEAALWCCNDGDYCNNQTMVMPSRVDGDATVTYYNFQNDSVTATCQYSSKLEELLQIQVGCQYENPGVDEDYYRSRECKSGATTTRPDCGTLENYWKYATHCSCASSLFYRNNVNDTYDVWLDAAFEATWQSTAEELIKWNKTLGCGWEPNSKWFCDAATFSKPMSLVAMFTLLVSLLSAVH